MIVVIGNGYDQIDYRDREEIFIPSQMGEAKGEREGKETTRLIPYANDFHLYSPFYSFSVSHVTSSYTLSLIPLPILLSPPLPCLSFFISLHIDRSDNKKSVIHSNPDEINMTTLVASLFLDYSLAI